MRHRDMKAVISILLGAGLGYALYYFFLMDLVAMLFSGAVYLPVTLLCLVMCVAGLSAFFYLLLARRIKKWVLVLLIAAYLCALALILFGRHATGGVFVWNPLVGLRELSDWEMRMQSILNFAAFLPMGFFFRRKNGGQTLLWSVVLAAALELAQALTMRGMFDTFDIILYVLGINLGAALFRHWRFEIV